MNVNKLIDLNGGEAIVFGEGLETHKCGKCLACNATPGVRAGKIIYRARLKQIAESWNPIAKRALNVIKYAMT